MKLSQLFTVLVLSFVTVNLVDAKKKKKKKKKSKEGVAVSIILTLQNH